MVNVLLCPTDLHGKNSDLEKGNDLEISHEATKINFK